MKRTREEELEMFTLFEMTPDLVCIAGKDGFFKNINPAVSKKLGYTREELFSRPIFSFMHPDDRELTGRKREALLSGEALLNFQNRYCAKNGDIVWLEWTSVYVPDKEVVFAIAKDITARKKLETEIEEKYKKFKGLAAHFKNSMEKDRKLMAIGLHEELAQLATVIKLDIESISIDLPHMAASSKARIAHTLATTQLLIHTIRKISFAISPNMLDDMGIHEVMECLCREFSLLTRIPCDYESTVDEKKLAHEIKLDVFRICQEWLNSAHHLPFTKIIVHIKEAGDTIQLTIEGEGKGIARNERQIAALTNIRKRVASVNGWLDVEAVEGEGARVCVTIAKNSSSHW